MKKILTFLVMLVACVSILSAQENLAKFNYQAVVRDAHNNYNLVQNETLDVTVQMSVGDNEFYSETFEGLETNFNGMVSFVIQAQEEGQFKEIDWSKVSIKATFKKGNDIVSVVETPVMAVPYALQAEEGDLEITTEKIVEYINGADGDAVNAIYQAIVTNNNNIKKDITDSIISYIKTQPEKVKELAIYFLGTVTRDEAKQAYDTLDSEVKQKIKEIIVDSIKANKALAYDILAYYLKNTTKDEVNELWKAARQNPQFHEIFDAVRDSAITYVMNHKELLMNVATYYIKNVLEYTDVQQVYQALQQNTNLYPQLLAKFNSYLESYIGDNYLRADDCEGVSICDLKEELDALKNNCPYIEEATISHSDLGWVFTATVINDATGLYATDGETRIPSILSTDSFLPSDTNPNVYQYLYEGNLNDGDYTFTIQKSGCPTTSKSAQLSNN